MAQTKNESGYIYGKVLLQNSETIPVRGISIDSDQANAKDSDINGNFVLFFPNSIPPDNVSIKIGNELNLVNEIEDTQGNLYNLYKPSSDLLNKYSLPEYPQRDSLYIYLVPIGEFAENIESANRGLKEDLIRTNSALLVEQNKNNSLIRANLIKDNKNEKLQNENRQLQKEIDKNEEFLITGKTYKQAYLLVQKKTDNASKRLKTFIELIEKGTAINNAIKTLDTDKAYSESAIGLDFAIRGIEEIEAYIIATSNDYFKREEVISSFDLITKIYKENPRLITDGSTNFLLKNFNAKRNFLIGEFEPYEFYDDLYFYSSYGNRVNGDKRSIFEDLIYAKAIKDNYLEILEHDDSNSYTDDYTFYWYLARACMALKDYNKALNYTMIARDLSLEYPLLDANNETNFRKALSHRYIIDERDLLNDQIRLLSQIGFIQYLIGNHRPSLDFLVKAIDLQKPISYNLFAPIPKLDLIATCIALGKKKKAQSLFYEFYKSALKENENISAELEMYHEFRKGHNNNLDEFYIELIKYLNIIEKRVKEPNYYFNLRSDLSFRIGEFYLNKNQYVLAEKYYKLSNEILKKDLTEEIVTKTKYSQHRILKTIAKNLSTIAEMWASIEKFDLSEIEYGNYLKTLKELLNQPEDIYGPNEFLRDCVIILDKSKYDDLSTKNYVPKKIGIEIIKAMREQLPNSSLDSGRLQYYIKKINKYELYFTQLNFLVYLREYHYDKLYYGTLSKSNDLHDKIGTLNYEEAMIYIEDIIGDFETYLNKYPNDTVATTNLCSFYRDFGLEYLNHKNVSLRMSAEIGLKGYEACPDEKYLLSYSAFAYLANGNLKKGIKIYRDNMDMHYKEQGYNKLKEYFLKELLRLQQFDEFKQLQSGGKYYDLFLTAKSILDN
ncbi:hypothetical protein [Winogradskyella sp. R77965]|uniref:hypothetical protein n=1 Tax=Winogradskyella sp. R77965 TaxID=3093872 RepID=UPI0037DDD48E